MKKYRIKETSDWTSGIGGAVVGPVYIVQVKTWWGAWVNVKVFYDAFDPEFAKSEAEELLERLEY